MDSRSKMRSGSEIRSRSKLRLRSTEVINHNGSKMRSRLSLVRVSISSILVQDLTYYRFEQMGITGETDKNIKDIEARHCMFALKKRKYSYQLL